MMRLAHDDFEFDGIHASIKRDAATCPLVRRQRIDGDVGAYARHPTCRGTGLGQGNDRAYIHVIRGVHGGHRDRFVHAYELFLRALRRRMRHLVLFCAHAHIRHGLDRCNSAEARPS